MPVPSAITDLSTTASSNSPAGSETPADGDNHLRAAYSFIAQLNANKWDKAGTVTPTANQPMGTYKFTGAGNASASGEFLVWGQTGTLNALTLTGNLSGGEVRTENRVSVPTVTGGAYTTIFDLNDFTTNRCAVKITLVCTENGTVNMHVYEYLVPRTSTTWATPVQTASAGVGTGGSQIEVQVSGGRYFQARGVGGTLVVQVQGTRQYFHAG